MCEFWQDYFTVMIDFNKNVLKIPEKNFYLVFFNYYYENILHLSLINKEKNTKLLKNIEQITENALKKLLDEN